MATLEERRAAALASRAQMPAGALLAQPPADASGASPRELTLEERRERALRRGGVGGRPVSPLRLPAPGLADTPPPGFAPIGGDTPWPGALVPAGARRQPPSILERVATPFYQQLVGGARDAVQGIYDASVWGAGELLRPVAQAVGDEAGLDAALADFQRGQLPEVPRPDNLLGDVVREGVRFGAGYGVVGPALKLGGVANPLIRAPVGGAAVDFSVYGPNEPRLSNLIEEYAPNPVTGYLAAGPDDAPLLGRLKNVAEGGLLGLGLEGTFRLIGSIARVVRKPPAALTMADIRTAAEHGHAGAQRLAEDPRANAIFEGAAGADAPDPSDARVRPVPGAGGRTLEERRAAALAARGEARGAAETPGEGLDAVAQPSAPMAPASAARPQMPLGMGVDEARDLAELRRSRDQLRAMYPDGQLPDSDRWLADEIDRQIARLEAKAPAAEARVASPAPPSPALSAAAATPSAAPRRVPLEERRAAALAARGASPGAPVPPVVSSKLGEFIDTRGAGERFHGTSSPIASLGDYYGSDASIYGTGLYATDAADIAAGYMRKGRGGQPTLYAVRERPGVKLYDLDQPIAPEIREAVERAATGPFEWVLDVAAEQPTLRAILDEVRAGSASEGISRTGVQEFFDGIVANLETQGYRGYRHAGGRETGRRPHDVRLYWTPAQDVEIAPASIERYRPTPGARAAPAAAPAVKPTSLRSTRAAEFAEVVVQQGPQSKARVVNHPDFDAAKNGDLDAAHRVVRAVVDPEVMARLDAMLETVEPGGAIVVAVDAGPGRNKLPRAYAEELASRLRIDVTGDIVQVSTARRRSMDAWQRIANGVEFDGPVQPGLLYILADDHVTMGTTLADLAGYIESRGGIVKIATALSSTDERPLLAPVAETLASLRRRHGTAEEWFRGRRGFGYERLTDAEAKRLLKGGATDALRNRIKAGGSAARLGEAARTEPPGPAPADAGRASQGGGAGGPEGTLRPAGAAPKPSLEARRAAALEARRTGPQRKSARAEAPRDLVTWLRSAGGIRDQAGELRHMGIDNRPRSVARDEVFLGALLRPNGMTFDDAALRAWEAGYFPGHAERPTVNEFLEALRGTFNADKAEGRRWREGEFPNPDALRGRDLEAEAAALGIDTSTLSGRALADDVDEMRANVEGTARPADAGDAVRRGPPTAGDILSPAQGRVLDAAAGRPRRALRRGVRDVDPATGAPVEAAVRDPTAPVRTNNINLDRVHTVADIRRVLEEVADQAGGFSDARRGVQAHALTEALARDLGMTVDDLIRRRRGRAFNAEEAFAARSILAESGERLTELAKAARGGSDENLIAFQEALARHVAIQEAVAGMTAEAGRALSQFRMIAASGKAREAAIRGVLGEGGARDRLGDIADKLSQLDDPAAVSRFAREAYRSTLLEKIQEAWINALLSGPRTHVVNVLSNTITALWSIPEEALAAAFGAVRGGADRVYVREVVSRTFGLVEGMKEGLAAAGKVLVTGEADSLFSKIETPRRNAIPGRLGAVIRTPGRLLEAEDAWFRAVGGRMELNARAMRDGLAKGLKGRALARHVAELRRAPPEDLRAAAQDAASYLTFTSALGKKGAAFQHMVAALPLLRFVVPFIRTPVNIVKYAAARTPFGVLMRDVRQELWKSSASGDLYRARMALGSAIGATAAYMAAEGSISGGGPGDSKLKASLYATGWQPYSVRIGDRWYAYGRLEPLGMLMGVSADFAELANEMEEAEAGSVAGLIVGSIATNLLSKTWLSGLSDLAQALNDPGRYGDHFVNRLVSSAVPTGVAHIAQERDPYLREARTMLDAIRARLPGVREQLPFRRDVWGRPIRVGGGVGPDLLSPIFVSPVSNDRVAQEVARLKLRLEMPERQIMDADLTVEEYDVLVQQSGGSAKAMLDRLVAAPAWERLPDDARRRTISGVLTRTREAARNAMVAQSPDLLRRIVEARRARLQ